MLNIHFNNTSYNISEAALNAASERIKTHLSTVMNGSGATINLGGVSYGIDSTKLSNATNPFVSHLGTIAGGNAGGGDTLTWDGTAKDGIIVDPDDEPMSYMSDVVLTENDLCNGYTIGVKNDDGVVFEETHNDCGSFGNVIVFGVMFSVLEDNISFEGMVFPKKGLYISSSIAEMIGEGNVFFLTIPNYTGFGGGSGSKLTVNGVEYSIDPTKLSGAVAELETVLGGLNSGGNTGGCDTLTWDGNTDGLVSVADMLYKISDNVLTIDDVLNGAIVTASNKEATTYSADQILEFTNAYGFVCFGGVYSVPFDNFEVQGMVFPKAGIYVMAAASAAAYTESITIPGYTGF